MALVLYHVEDAAKEKQLSALCRELHLTARRLTNADRDRAVAALCGEKVNVNVQKAPAGYKLPEVLIFSGFAGILKTNADSNGDEQCPDSLVKQKE